MVTVTRKWEMMWRIASSGMLRSENLKSYGKWFATYFQGCHAIILYEKYIILRENGLILDPGEVVITCDRNG
jgi:hypothetical protein